MAQRGRGVLRSDPDPYRARRAHPPPRLFRHPAALRGADGDGADLRDHRPLRAELAAADLARALSRHADRADADADLAGRRAMVLQPARLAARVRARLRDGARGRRRRICAPPHRADPLAVAADRRGQRLYRLESDVARSDPDAAAAAAVHRRQDLCDADAADPVSGADRFVFGDLSLYQALGASAWSSSARCWGAIR